MSQYMKGAFAAFTLVASAAFLPCPAAYAQDVPTSVEDQIRDQFWSKVVSAADGNLLGNLKGVTLETQDGQETLKLNYGLPTTIQESTRGSGQNYVHITNWSFEASAPINRNGQKGLFPALDSLKNAITAKASFTWTSVPVEHDVLDAFNSASAWSTKQYDAVLASVADGSASAACLTYLSKRSGKTADQLTSSTPQQLATDLDTYKASTRFAELCSPDYYWAEVETRWRKDWSKSFGFSGSIGQEDFDYFDAVSFNEVNTTKQVYAAEAFAAVSKQTSGMFMQAYLGLEYSRTFGQNDATNGCKPDDPTDCMTAIFGAPRKKESLKIKGEWKSRISLCPRGGCPIAYVLRATYDTKDDVFGAELPVYLLTDQLGNLSSGVKLGWRDDTDDVTFGVFVGSKF